MRLRGALTTGTFMGAGQFYSEKLKRDVWGYEARTCILRLEFPAPPDAV